MTTCGLQSHVLCACRAGLQGVMTPSTVGVMTPNAAIAAKTAKGRTVHVVNSDTGDILTTACGRTYWREMPRDEFDNPPFADHGHHLTDAPVTCRTCQRIGLGEV